MKNEELKNRDTIKLELPNASDVVNPPELNLRYGVVYRDVPPRNWIHRVIRWIRGYDPLIAWFEFPTDKTRDDANSNRR